MRWNIPVTVAAPFAPSSLSAAVLQLPDGVDPGRCRFTLAGAAAGDDALAVALAAAGFASCFDTPAPTLPAPWRTLTARADTGALANARRADTGVALRLIEPPKRRPVDPQNAAQQLQRLDALPARVAEALAFGLLDGRLALEPDHALLGQWQAAIRACVHGRSDESLPKRDGGSALLAGLRALLETLERQRRAAGTLADWQAGWTALLSGCPAPAACGLVYWSEATYRLSECGNFAAADAAVAEQKSHADRLVQQLPGLGDALDTGLWRHHLGRLAYYDGRFRAALEHFGAEWQHVDGFDSTRRARLYRHVANLLSDLGELAAAGQLAEEAIRTLQQLDDPETYKAHGRLGEIRLRAGDGPGAQAAFAASWRARQATADASAQTAIYRGHAALLAGDTAAAASAYATAETLPDGDNAYLWMGRAALYLATGDRTALEELRALASDDLAALRGAGVLPAAVFASACALAGLEGTEVTLAAATERLLAENYLIEALYPLVQLHARPSGAAAALTQIEAGLDDWQQATRRFMATTGLPTGSHDHPTPARLCTALAACRAADDWQPLAALRRRIHPFSLLAGGR